MKKMMLSVTAFLLSANLSNAKAQELELTKIIQPSQLEKEQSTRYIEFQRWLRNNNNLIGKRWIGENGLKNISEKEITTQQIKESLPSNLKNYLIRIISPNSIVTMEFNSNRINISLNNESKIVKIYLG